MWKINFRKLSFAIAALTILTILLYAKPSGSQTSFNWKWSPQIAFRLPAYKTVIAFNDYVYMNSFTWDAFNASAVTFNDICFQGEPETATHFTISLRNANITILQLSHNKQFIAELNGLTGTVAELSITHSLYQSMPGTVAVAGLPLTTPCATKADFDSYGGNTWYYDTTTNTVRIKATLHSPTSIYIDWNPAPAPAPAPTPTPTPTPTPQPTITPTPTIPSWAPILIIALIIIALLAIRKLR
jgi:hypothetical protein